MLARLLLSILVDADRWDSACFDYDADPFESPQEERPDWEQLLANLDTFMKKFPKKGAWPEYQA